VKRKRETIELSVLKSKTGCQLFTLTLAMRFILEHMKGPPGPAALGAPGTVPTIRSLRPG